MSRYTGPKARINRRLGEIVMENNGAIKAMNRRPFPPGVHGQGRKKTSEFAEGLREKQKVRFFYGLSDRQVRNLFKKAKKAKGNTGENLMLFLERRADNVVRIAGFAHTRAQSRQFVNHGHFKLNGRKVDIASVQMSEGDVLQVRPRNKKLFEGMLQDADATAPGWLEVSPEEQTIKVLALPSYDDVSLRADLGKLVEFLSR